MSNPVRIGVGGRFTVVRLALPAALTLLCMLAIASPASALEQTVIVSGNDLLGSQMIYDLRRLRRKGLIRRVPKTQGYELTEFGRMIVVFFTKTYVRILNPSLAELDPTLPDDIADHQPLARHWRAYEHALDQRITAAA